MKEVKQKQVKFNFNNVFYLTQSIQIITSTCKEYFKIKQVF